MVEMSRFDCPTCAVIYGALRSVRVPDKAARKISRSRTARAVDQAAKRQTKKGIRRVATTKAARKMSTYLKEANAKARKKNGSFKKGWDQRRVMREAHRLRRLRG